MVKSEKEYLQKLEEVQNFFNTPTKKKTKKKSKEMIDKYLACDKFVEVKTLQKIDQMEAQLHEPQYQEVFKSAGERIEAHEGTIEDVLIFKLVMLHSEYQRMNHCSSTRKAVLDLLKN